MNKWIDRGLQGAQRDSEFQVVKMDDAIEAGYNKQGKVVIDIK